MKDKFIYRSEDRIIDFCLATSTSMCDEMSRPLTNLDEWTAMKNCIDLMEQLMGIAKTCCYIKEKRDAEQLKEHDNA